MLMPKRTKFRKMMKGRNRGEAHRGNSLAYGDFGIKAVEHGRVDSRQIEASRVAMTRKVKRQAKVWIMVFPDKPLTAKPLETRIGKGKGSGVDEGLAREALALAMHKLPFKTKFVTRDSENELY